MNVSALICGQLVAAGCILLTFFECGECSSNSSDIELRNNSSTILTDIEAKNCTAAGLPHQTSCTSKSRRKRYVAFPEGSSFSVAFCATVGFVGNPNFIYFSWAINWGLAYDLPNETWIINQRNRKPFPKPLVQRRHRRELFEKLELAIDNMGYNGRSCILRALCESAQYFYKRTTNMVEELIKSIFSLPEIKVLPFEHHDLQVYDSAHRKGRSKVFCPVVYPECSFSLIDLALGEYSNPFNYM